VCAVLFGLFYTICSFVRFVLQFCSVCFTVLFGFRFLESLGPRLILPTIQCKKSIPQCQSPCSCYTHRPATRREGNASMSKKRRGPVKGITTCIHTCPDRNCLNQAGSLEWLKEGSSINRHVKLVKKHPLCAPGCAGFEKLLIISPNVPVASGSAPLQRENFDSTPEPPGHTFRVLYVPGKRSFVPENHATLGNLSTSWTVMAIKKERWVRIKDLPAAEGLIHLADQVDRLEVVHVAVDEWVRSLIDIHSKLFQ
jgi:hypothetical protein